MLDALVDREDREVPGAGQTAVVVHGLQVPEHGRTAVGLGDDAVDEVGAGEMQLIPGDGLAGVAEQVLRLVAEHLLNTCEH